MPNAKRDVRRDLVEAAANLLAEEGPQALSARALGRQVGTSTMAVYTHFGGMPAVVRAVIHEGFARLAAELASVPVTDDPVADGFELAHAYRRSAHASPHLYRVMFGGSSAAGFNLTGEDRAIGLYTIRVGRDAVARCIDAGRFRPIHPWPLTRQLWCQVHGLVTLELAGFYAVVSSADAEFRQYLEYFAIGAGDSPERATDSAARAFTSPSV